MDMITYSLSKKIAASALSGVKSMSVEGQTLKIVTNTDGTLTMSFPSPKDGLSVTDIDVNANNQIVFTMSDGSTHISGKIPTVKGDKGDPGLDGSDGKSAYEVAKDNGFVGTETEWLESLKVKGDIGFSPTITENADNTDNIYKLDIETADGKFTTPNLKGADGTGGEGASKWSEISDKPFSTLDPSTLAVDETGKLSVIGGGTVDVPIKSVSVNGTSLTPDENKNVDISVPSIEGLTKDADLATVAKSGDYEDLINKPTIPSLSGYATETYVDNKVADYTKTADLADVATTGSYNDLADKPTIPEAYDDTALSGRVTDVETSIGDTSLIQVQSVSDLVSAINSLYNAFMSSITYANKKLTITYRNGSSVDIDMSAIITDTKLTELSDVDDTGITDKQVLSYDSATSKYIPTTIDTAGVLADAKKYTDDEIKKINNADAIAVDEKPTYSDGTITYKKDGVESTIKDGDYWFFYTVDDMAYQTIWIDGVEFTTSVDGSVDFNDFVSKTNDLASTYTGEEIDKTKVTTIASLDALYAIISTALGKKVNTTDIVDNLASDATDKPLSAAQGKALDGKFADYTKTEDLATVATSGSYNDLSDLPEFEAVDIDFKTEY